MTTVQQIAGTISFSIPKMGKVPGSPSADKTPIHR
jgi:hypothetical protein